MREQNSLKNMNQLHRESSIRLRRRRDEVKEQFVKNRRSGDFGYRLSSDAPDSTNTKVNTLDPATDHIHHKLRPLLRKMYDQYPLRTIEDNMESGWGTWSRRGGPVKIKHFGMIDNPQQEDVRSFHSLQHQPR